MSGRPPLLIQRVRHALRSRGYSMGLSWDKAEAVFCEYVGYYLAGLTTSAFLRALADEILLSFVKQKDGQPHDGFLEVLITVSTFSSDFSPYERTHHVQILEQFMQKK